MKIEPAPSKHIDLEREDINVIRTALGVLISDYEGTDGNKRLVKAAKALRRKMENL